MDYEWQKLSASISGGKAIKARIAADPQLMAMYQQLGSTAFKNLHASGRIKYDTFKGKKHTEETKAKMREARRLRFHK